MKERSWAGPHGLLVLAVGAACGLDDRGVGVQEPMTMQEVAPNATAGAGSTSTPPAFGTGGSAGTNGLPPSTAPESGLKVTFGGDGFGQVTLSADGQVLRTCESELECRVSVPAGTLVTAEALARPYSVFRAWSDVGCGTRPQACSIRADAEAALRVDFQLAYNVAFASSHQYGANELPQPGDAANQECARLAEEAGVHGTRWVAWLAAEGATTALADDITPAAFLQNPGGWVRRDGVPLARSRRTLLGGEILHPLNLTEYATPALSYAWSGAGMDGTLRRDNGAVWDCNNWSSVDANLVGTLSFQFGVGLRWSNVMVGSCDFMNALQCFGDDPAPEVPIHAVSGRLAFVTATDFVPGGGLQAADDLCQREACEAGLTGSSDCTGNLGAQRSFRSYLHTSAQPAWQRFDLSRPNWVRADGIEWLSTASDLAQDGLGKLTGLNVHADGSFELDAESAWSGAPSGGDCESWTSSTVTGYTANFDIAFSDTTLTNAGAEFAFDCRYGYRLLCLEE